MPRTCISPMVPSTILIPASLLSPTPISCSRFWTKSDESKPPLSAIVAGSFLRARAKALTAIAFGVSWFKSYLFASDWAGVE